MRDKYVIHLKFKQWFKSTKHIHRKIWRPKKSLIQSKENNWFADSYDGLLAAFDGLIIICKLLKDIGDY